MFFSKKDNYTLYTFDAPFIETTSEKEILGSYLYLDDEDKLEKKAIDNQILRFCEEHRIVTFEKGAHVITVKDGGHWTHTLLFRNYRSLTSAIARNQILESFLPRPGYEPTIYLVELFTRLGIQCDQLTLSKLITRTYRSLSVVPFPLEDPQDFTIPLTDTHLEYPYLWLLPYTQSLIGSQFHIPRD